MKYILVTNSKGGSGKTCVANALHELLPNSVIWDTDPQGSSIKVSQISNKESVVVAQDPKKGYDFCIIDTPPYQVANRVDLLKKADKIIIPCKTGVYDAVAISDTLNNIAEHNMVEKSIIVLNEVRQPVSKNRLFKEIKELLQTNYPQFIIADNYVSLRISLQTVSLQTMDKKAREEINNLITEVCL